MPERLKAGAKLAGSKQTRRAIREGRAQAVFIAQDADPFVTRPVQEMAEAGGIAVIFVPTMKELGTLCGVEVPTACAALL